METVAVIIPALNEAGNIDRLVREILSLAIPGTALSVWVVDNGSSDDTAGRAAAAGAHVLREPHRGYGFACAAGAREATQAGAGVLVFLDGDYSSLPSELPQVVQPILNDDCDLVQGSRLLGCIVPGAMPPQQLLGNRLAAWLIRRLFGAAVTDLGPYRALRPATLQRLDLREFSYGWTAEMTVKAARLGLRICEPPVTFARRRAGRSKVSGTLRGTLLAGWFILGVTLRHALAPAAASTSNRSAPEREIPHR